MYIICLAKKNSQDSVSHKFLFSLQGQCTYYLPRKEEFIVYGLLMIEVEAEDQRNGFCRRHIKLTNTKVKLETNPKRISDVFNTGNIQPGKSSGSL